MAEDLNAPRPIELAVVVHPATHRRIDEPSQVLQALIVPGRRQPPLADGCSDRFGGLDADRWQEAHERLAPAILGPTRLEGVAQEVERYVLVLPTPIVVLAIHDPGLRGMKLQTALDEPIPDGLQHLLGLPLAPAMDDGI